MVRRYFCIVALSFSINLNIGLEVYGEMILENGDLGDQTADQRLIKLRYSSIIDSKAAIKSDVKFFVCFYVRNRL